MNPIFALRPLSTTGHYPSPSFIDDDAGLLLDETSKTLYSIVRILPDDNSFFKSDLSWALPSEIRLWASHCLSIPPSEGALAIIPCEKPCIIYESEIFEMETIELVAARANILMDSKDIQMKWGPVDSSASNYSFQENLTFQINFRTLYEAIETSNRTLMRGLSCFLKSQILSRSQLTIEESALLCYISSEAIFILLREKLGFKKFDEVYSFIENTFPNGRSLSEYSSLCRKNRNMLSHPDYDEKVSILADLGAEDFFETYSALTEMYRYLIGGFPVENTF